MHRPRLLRPILCLVLLASWGVGVAEARVDGDAHRLAWQHRVFGQAVTTGNTLMQTSVADPRVNSFLLDRSTAEVRGVPFDAEVVGAYLFWSGSLANRVDRSVRFEVADGTTFANVGADRCSSVQPLGGAFYCRADVTDLLRDHPGAQQFNGSYSVGDLDAEPGTLVPDGEGGVVCAEPEECQAKFAAWSLIVVYEAASARGLRDVFIYDGFRQYDETFETPGIDQFRIEGFDFPDQGRARLSYFAMEGDLFLGVPPQDTDPLFPCATCFDFLEFNGSRLGDGTNPGGNLFNSSTALGVDLEGFDVSGLIPVGSRTARIRVGSGDGIVDRRNPDPAGGGEMFMLGYVLLDVDRNAPDFRRDGTQLSVVPDEGAPRERVVITLRIENEGTLDANSARVRLALPPGLTYLPGSLRIDGADPVAGEEVVNPLAAGYALGRIPFQGDNDRIITLRATIDADARAGQRIISQGFLSADELEGEVPTNEALLVVLGGLDLGQVTKTVSDSDGDGRYAPGELVTYRVFVPNPNNRDVSGVQLVDRLPAGLELLQAVAPSGDDRSDPANGLVAFDELVIPGQPGGGLTVTILARVRDTAGLIAAGIPAGAINGFVIANQAEVVAAGARLRSDDPTTAGAGDATEFAITAAVDITGAATRKSVVDVDGGLVEPGDTLRFTIDVSNQGTAPAEVFVSDPLPAGLEACVIETAQANLICAGGRLQGLVTVPAGGRERIVFTTRIGADVAHDTVLRNVATLRASADPNQQPQVASEPIRVIAAPSLSDTRKQLVGHGEGVALPGERLRYEIAVPNTGNRPALDVVVTDDLAFDFVEVTPADGGVYDADAQSLRWQIPRIEPGETVTVAFEAVLPPAVPDGTRVDNQARVSAMGVPAVVSDDPRTPEADDATSVIVRSEPRLVLRKTVQPRQASPGDAVVYQIVVRNDGTDAARAAAVEDPLPEGVFTDVVPDAGGRLVDGQVVWADLGDLAVGAERTLTVRARLAGVLPDGLEVANQARGLAEGVAARVSDDPDTPEAGDATVLVIDSTPELTISKRVEDLNGGDVQPGDALRYVLSIQATGDAPLTNVAVRDPLPAGLTEVEAEGGGVAGGVATWAVPGPRGPGDGPLELVLLARVAEDAAPGAVISNRGFALADGVGERRSDDPDTPTADDATTVVVVSRPDLTTSTKTAEPREAEPGALITWRVDVVNSGNAAADAVVVRDPVPAEIEVVDAGGGDRAGAEIVWAVGALPPRARRVFTWTGRVRRPLADGALIRNQAVVIGEGLPASPTDDPDTPEADDATVVTVRSAPALALQKTVEDPNGAPVRPGDALRYRLRLVNTGGTAATSVLIRDVLPPALTIDSVDGAAQIDGETITWALDDLPIDQPLELTFTARVAMPLPNGTLVDNQATVQVAELPGEVRSDDPVTAELGDPTRVQVVSAADLGAFTKTVQALDDPPFRPGGRVRYTLEVTNRGDDVARQIVISDPIPAELEAVAPTDGQVQNGALVWQPADLAVGASARTTFTAQIRRPLDDGTEVSNRAEARIAGAAAPFVSDDPATDAVDATRFVVRAEAALVFEKTIEAPEGLPLRPGDAFDYVLSLRNEGDADARDVVVTDAIPAGLVELAVPAPGALDGRTARWSVPRVGVGAEPVQLRVRARVPEDAADGTTYSNQGQAGPLASDDPTTAADGDPTVASVRAGPDFTGSPKTVSGDFVPGGRVVYRVDVRNRGLGAAQGVVVTDPLPAGLTVVRTEPPGAVAGGEITWRLGDLAAGERRTLIIEAQVAEAVEDGLEVANQATVLATGLPPALTDDPEVEGPADATRFTVVARPELALVKSVRDDNGGAFEPGDPITYTLQIGNEGSTAARDVEVIDPFDPQLVQAVAPEGQIEAGIATWQVPRIEPGEHAQVVLRARVGDAVPDGAEIVNQFGARLPGADFSRSDEVSFIVQRPSLALDKTVRSLLPGGFRPGSAVEYQLQVRNTGDQPALGVVVVDPVDLGRLEQIEALDGGIFDPRRGTVEWGAPRAQGLAAIPPGGVVVLRVRGTLLASLQPGDEVLNQATASAGATSVPSDDPVEPGASDPTRLVVVGGPAYDVRKDVVDPRRTEVEAGRELTYRITVANQGTGVGQQVTLLDSLPAEVAYVRGSTRMDGRAVPDAGRGAPFVGGGLLLTDALAPGGQVRVEFTVLVRAGLPAGTVIANQAEVRDATGLTEPSDDPTTRADDDPTRVTLGGRPDLSSFDKSFQIVGGGGRERAAPGDVIEWQLALVNRGAGPARAVEISDPLPARTRYVPGTLRLNGRALSDARDGDDGEFDGAARARADELAPGGRLILTFRTRVEAGPTVENQGLADATGEVTRRSPRVVVPVGDAPVRRAVIRKTVNDPTGAPALAGEGLFYDLEVENTGTVDLFGLTVIDDLPPGMIFEETLASPPGSAVRYEPPPAGAFGAGRVTVSAISVGAGATARTRLGARVDPALPGDRTICNGAQVLGDDIAGAEADPACVEAEVRYGAVAGATFEDRDGDGAFDAEADVAFVDMRVAAYGPDDLDGAPVAEARTDALGAFELRDLRPGTYRLRAFSSTGTLLRTLDGVVLAAPEVKRQDLLIDPTGRVYDSAEGGLIDGAEVFIYRDDDPEDADPFDEPSMRLRVLVPPEDLEAASQQGQRTAHGGVYQFAVRRPGRYVVEVVPPGPSYVSPSVLVPATPGVAFTDDPQRRVVEADLPTTDPESDRTYFLAFDLRGPDDAFYNNHIPVDPLSALIDLEKRASRRAVTLGDVVTWTVDVVNRSPEDLVWDPRIESGGVFVQDVLPKGLKYVAGSAVLVRVREGREVALAADDPVGARILRFGQVLEEGGRRVLRPMNLHAGEHLRLRYQAVVGADAKPQRDYTNRVTLLADGNVPVSRTAKATVRVIADPDFDQGLLIGKVFCDTDGDGRQGPGERGLSGARLFMDHGYFAETGGDGKFHFKDLDPGTHAVKIDRDSLLPGAELTTDELRVISFTRGLPAKVDFGVTCPAETVEGARLELAPGGLEAALAALRGRATVVVGDVNALSARAGQVDQVAAPVLASLEVGGAPADGKDLPAASLQGPNRLVFRTALSTGAPEDRWVLRVGVVGADAVAVARGSGPPPVQVPWSGRALDGTPLLQPGKAWWWQLEVADRSGHLVASRPGVVGVDVNGPPEAELITRFGSEGLRRRPSRSQREALMAVADRLRALPGRVVVEAHTDNEQGPLIARRETRRQAARVAAWLSAELGLPADKIEAVGRGNTQPVVPNISPSSRRRNRRIEIRHQAPNATPSEPVELPRPAWTPAVRIDTERYAPDDSGHFAVAADVPPDGVVEVLVQAADGRRAVFALPVRPGSPVTPGQLRKVAIEGTLPGALRVGGGAVPVRGLDLRAEAVDTVPIEGSSLTEPIRFTLAAPGALRWRLSIVGPRGTVVHSVGGEGAPDGEILWAGPEDRPLAGLYRYRLTARLPGGLVAQSPEGVLRVGALVAPPPAPEKGRWQLLADGVAVGPSAEGDRVFGTAELRGDEAVLLEVRSPKGARALFFFRPPDEKAPDAPVTVAAPAGPRVAVPTPPIGGGDGGVEPKGGRPAYAKVDQLFPAPTTRQPLPPAQRDAMAAFGRAELLQVLAPELGDADADVPARELSVELPPAGAELAGRTLPIRGVTRPGNRVEVNGVPMPVDREGRFAGAAPTPQGTTQIEVVAIDPAGNRGVIRRPVTVRDHGWFLLALGESQLGLQGAELDGVTETTSVTMGDALYLHGRAAVYFKGHLKGAEVLGGLFEQYEATAHIDTARRRQDQAYFRQLVDPETFYPVYGDTARETKDVNSRGPLYVLVKADESTLRAGNFRTRIRGVELLNYDRTLYGAAVHLDKKTGPVHHDLKAFVSDVDTPERHAYVELRGTGGSLYYLPHRELVEGSERVYLVERDKISNLERRKVSLTRGVDYTVRYADGRVLMKTPVPSVTLDAFGALPQPSGEVLDGHPVFLAIEYDHQDIGSGGDVAAGVHARETLNDAVSIGGGYIREGRSGAGLDYTLWGADLRLKHKRRTRLEAEFARSQSTNAQNLFSPDGGLTFQAFNGRDGSRTRGSSFLVRGGLEIDDFIGKGDTDHWYTEGYWQYLAPGFYSGGSIQQQGLESYGALTRYALDEHHQLRLQHDGTSADAPESQGEAVFTAYRKEVTRLGHTYTAGALQLDSEFVHTQIDDGRGDGVMQLDVATVGARYRLDERWTLLAEQEVVARGDERIHNETLDLFASTVGARYRASEALELELTETVRWSGDNATQLGVRTQLDDRHTLYGQQRLIQRDGAVNSTTVIGGEERWGAKKSGRLFGEYQLESGVLGERNRAVMGVGKRTELLKGLTLDAGYQRSQVVGGGAGEFSQDALSLGVEWLDSDRLKVSGRYELRYEDNDELAGRRDRLQLLALNAASLKLHRDVTLLLRANYSHTIDLAFDASEAELLEGSVGFAWRPVDHDWLAVIAKYTKRYEQRPTDLSLELPEREESDVVSVIPIFELPYRFQLVEKLAWKRTAVRAGAVPGVVGHTILWINRLNYHLTDTWDAGVEYRYLRSTLAQNQLHGTLLELNYIIQKTVRLGAGYNFTSFSDDEFSRLDEHFGGPFFRVVAHY